jgi:hypothetical protein
LGEPSVVENLNFFPLQLLSAALCILPTASYGCMLTYVSVGLPQFLNNNNTMGLIMDQEEATWFGEFFLRKKCRKTWLIH